MVSRKRPFLPTTSRRQTRINGVSDNQPPMTEDRGNDGKRLFSDNSPFLHYNPYL
ncbi:MAG: hypothetical protein KDE56_27585 [Anaerolineales bacterium]|nr:hypothetical protein [Anaerolineales bacterium]